LQILNKLSCIEDNFELIGSDLEKDGTNNFLIFCEHKASVKGKLLLDITRLDAERSVPISSARLLLRNLAFGYFSCRRVPSK
jgi:hypothetical protein